MVAIAGVPAVTVIPFRPGDRVQYRIGLGWASGTIRFVDYRRGQVGIRTANGYDVIRAPANVRKACDEEE